MTILLPLLAFTLLAAGTHRQAQALFGRARAARIRRIALGSGYALLALSLTLRLGERDWSRGLVEWFGDLTLSAMLVVAGCWVLVDRRAHARTHGTPPPTAG